MSYSYSPTLESLKDDKNEDKKYGLIPSETIQHEAQHRLTSLQNRQVAPTSYWANSKEDQIKNMIQLGMLPKGTTDFLTPNEYYNKPTEMISIFAE